MSKKLFVCVIAGWVAGNSETSQAFQVICVAEAHLDKMEFNVKWYDSRMLEKCCIQRSGFAAIDCTVGSVRRPGGKAKAAQWPALNNNTPRKCQGMDNLASAERRQEVRQTSGDSPLLGGINCYTWVGPLSSIHQQPFFTTRLTYSDGILSIAPHDAGMRATKNDGSGFEKENSSTRWCTSANPWPFGTGNTKLLYNYLDIMNGGDVELSRQNELLTRVIGWDSNEKT